MRDTESMLLESSVTFPQSVMIWAAVSSAGVGPLCFLKSTVNAAVYQEILEHFMLMLYAFSWQALWRCWFNFPAGLGTCPHCQRYQKLVQWPWCYCAWLSSKLTRPEPQRESVRYCQEEDERHQTQQCRWPEGRFMIFNFFLDVPVYVTLNHKTSYKGQFFEI